jgi:hypothetical protein
MPGGVSVELLLAKPRRHRVQYVVNYAKFTSQTLFDVMPQIPISKLINHVLQKAPSAMPVSILYEDIGCKNYFLNDPKSFPVCPVEKVA